MQCSRCGREMTDEKSGDTWIGASIDFRGAKESFYKIYPELKGVKDGFISVCLICWIQALDIPQFRNIPFQR